MKESARHNEPLWTATFVGLMLIGILTSASFFMITPIISKYAATLGATLGLAGVISGLFSITALTMRPLGALLADRCNKKQILAAATALMGIASFGYALSDSMPLLLVFRILHGTAFAISGTTVSALIATIVPRKRMGEGIGYYGMAHIISTAIGPNVGIWIADAFGYRTNFTVAGSVMLAGAFILFLLRYRPVVRSDAAQEKKGIRASDLISLQVLPLAVFGGLFSFTNGIVSSFLVMVGDERGIANIGLYFTVMAACLFVVRPLTGRLADRVSLSFIVLPAFVLVACEALLLSRATTLWMVLLAAAAKAVGQGAAQPAIQSACMKKLDVARSGVAAATYFIGADIGQGVGPMIGGALSERFGYGAMFQFSMGLMLLGGLAFFLFQRANRDGKKKRNERAA